MIDQINQLPEDGLKSLPETSRYIENTLFSRKIQTCSFLDLIDFCFNGGNNKSIGITGYNTIWTNNQQKYRCSFMKTSFEISN